MAAARTTKAKATEAKAADEVQPKGATANAEETRKAKEAGEITPDKVVDDGSDAKNTEEQAEKASEALKEDTADQADTDKTVVNDGEFTPPREVTPEFEGEDKIRDADDVATSAASNAAVVQGDEPVPAERLMYQTSQFDTSSGTSVLSSLAYPPASAIRAEEVVDAKLANGGVDDNKN